MRLSFRLHKQVPESLHEAFFRGIARETLLAGLPESVTSRSFLLSAVSVSEHEIQNLNARYRKKDAVTDILSFWNFSSREELLTEKDATIDLGELFFSPRFIRKAAHDDGVAYRREMTYVFSHGVLHLIGYDHEPEMFRIQDRVTDRFAPNILAKK